MTSMPAGSSTPKQHGRFRLDDPREDAERLLDAALSGDRRCLARIAVHRLTPVSEKPGLRDALHTVSREMGFQGWDHFQRHVAALDTAGERAERTLDDDLDTVHIRCGSDLRDALPATGLHGHFHTFSDPFCIGPLHSRERQAFMDERTRFLCEVFGGDENETRRRQQHEYDGLDQAMDSERVVLWFEHDSYDQLILAYILNHLALQRRPTRLELVATDGIPGVDRFIGLGQLAPEVLGWLWQQRRPVDDALITLGRRAWRAVTADTPQRLDDLSRTLTPELPMLGRALRRHLLELPDEATGLGLSEQLAVQLVAERGPITVGEVFRDLTREREPLPYLGDTMFWWMMQPLMGGERPLLTSDHGEDTPWQDRSLHITSHGHAVLSGHNNWLDTHPGRRWVGGIAIDGDRDSWCLNKGTGRPQKRPANVA
ncbi:DUF1835 domain-containing protein [Alloalcanivorax venustensis]|nr:DUF1835 domain-containing protein [Alloalcanivorax venustensis]